MKKSDIRQIIKEEVINLIRAQYINEAFGDPLITKINQLGGLDGNRWNNFWKATAKTYDIAWDKLPKGTTQKIQPTDKTAIADGQLSFWVVNTDKPNPYVTGWESNTIRAGVHAVTLGGKVLYFGRRGESVGGKGGSSAYDVVGKGQRGTLMVKKIKELADHVYTFNLEAFRGGTTALKSKRAELKSGKDKFTDHKQWKKANMDRYKAILADRIQDPKGLGRMVGEILKIGHKWIEDALVLPKTGRYGDLIAKIGDVEVNVKIISDQTNRALESLARIHREYNEHAEFLKKYPEYQEGGKSYRAATDTKGSSTDISSFGKATLRDEAMKIKKIHQTFKAEDGKALSKLW
jgi:hypothetical protein